MRSSLSGPGTPKTDVGGILLFTPRTQGSFWIERIVRETMNELGAQEILMPALQPREPWDVTGRWEQFDVMYKIKAGDRDLCLGPTHEEIVTPLIGGYISSYKDLPRAGIRFKLN